MQSLENYSEPGRSQDADVLSNTVCSPRSGFRRESRQAIESQDKPIVDIFGRKIPWRAALMTFHADSYSNRPDREIGASDPLEDPGSSQHDFFEIDGRAS